VGAVTVYGVARGEYSDYQVVCICPSKAEAEALCERMNQLLGQYEYSRYEVASFPEADSTARRVDQLVLTAWIAGDGTCDGDSERHELYWDFGDRFTQVEWSWSRPGADSGRPGHLQVAGIDHDAVRAAFAEQLARLRTDPAYRARARFSDIRVWDDDPQPSSP
jgi:hypothetical protein